MQELVEGTRCRGECHRRYDLASASDGAEDQICAAGVEGEHDTRVFHTSSGRLPPALAVIDHVASLPLSLIHISEPTRLGMISYAVFCLKKKKNITKRVK